MIWWRAEEWSSEVKPFPVVAETEHKLRIRAADMYPLSGYNVTRVSLHSKRSDGTAWFKTEPEAIDHLIAYAKEQREAAAKRSREWADKLLRLIERKEKIQ